MTQRVGVEFDGNSRGVVNASRQAAQGIAQVKREAGGAGPALRGFEQDLGRATRGAIAGSGAFRGLGRSLAFASAGFLGGFGLASAVRGAADELVNSVKVNAQVQAVLRTTGGVAGVTAKHMDELAAAQLRKTGADDELVKKAGAVLLTFRNVRDVAGKGNDVFDRAIKLSGDLAVIFGNDLPSAALQLGKALQEPTTGLTALRRAGVSFTTAQREQIKTLVEHNRLLEAQKIILREVERQVGGTAERVGQVAPWMRLRETIKNLSATAITPLLPEIDQITKRVQTWADELANNSETQQRFKHDVEEGIGVAKDMVKVADKVSGALGGWKNTMEILLALKVVSVLAGWTTAIKTLIGTEAVAGAASTASGLAGAAGSAGLLRGRLAALAKLGPITVTIALALIPKYGDNKNPNRGMDWFESLPVVGGLFSQANRLANAANEKLGITSTPVPGGGTAGRARRPGESSLTGGLVSVAAGANRKGVALKPHVVAFVSDLSAEIGSPLTITTGTNHNEYVLGSGNVSQHWTGDAADIAASGDWLTRLGQAALRVAGADPAWAAKQTGGAFTVGGVNILFNTLIGGNHFNHLHVGLKSWSGRALPTAEKTVTPAGAKPPTSGGATPAASTNVLPSRIRQAISAAGVAAAQAALTPGKADDKAAVAQQRAALESEIAWINAKLATKLGPEKRITLEDLLAGALGDLAGLQPAAKKKAGASVSTITSLRTSVNEALRNLPTTLDDVEQQAVSKLQKLRDHLKVGMTAKDLASTRAGITHWGNVLKDEIAKQAKVAADAAQEATRLWQRGWQNDVDRILRDFRENVVQKQLDDFDKETAAGLARRAAVAQTPEEQALAAFQASRAASEKAKRKADLQAQIADTKAQLAALGVTTANGPLGDIGAMIDISTGIRTGVAGDQAVKDTVDQQKQLTQQLLDLQDQYQQTLLDDQQQALQDAADASRRAADEKAAADQQAYQDQRATQRQALQDLLDDQTTALSQNLDDWNIWLDNKKKSWKEFVDWLQKNGFSTAGLTPPPGQTGAGASGAASEGAIPRALLGHAIPFQHGGTVPGLYVGRRDTVMARLTPGEHVIDRQLSEDLRDFLAGGGRSGATVAIFNIDGREFARSVADPISDEQARRIGYTIQRG